MGNIRVSIRHRRVCRLEWLEYGLVPQLWISLLRHSRLILSRNTWAVIRFCFPVRVLLRLVRRKYTTPYYFLSMNQKQDQGPCLEDFSNLIGLTTQKTISITRVKLGWIQTRFVYWVPSWGSSEVLPPTSSLFGWYTNLPTLKVEGGGWRLLSSPNL